MSLKQLAGQTAIYGISSIAARMLNYLLTPYLTRVMTTGDYGIVTHVYALIPFALVVLTMGLETGYFRFAGTARGEEERRDVFTSTWGVVLLASGVFLGLVTCFTPGIAAAMGYGERPSIAWLVGAIIAVDAASAIPFCRLREQGRAGRFVVLKVTSVVINVAACLFLTWALPRMATGGGMAARAWDAAFLPGYVLVANLVASVVAFLLVLPACGWPRPRVKWRVLKPVLLYSMPLLVSGVAGTANEYIDREMIRLLMPPGVALASLGVYGAVVKLGVILLLFTQVYRYSAEPYFLSGAGKGDLPRANAAAMKYFIIVSIALFLVITLFADLFALIVGQDFREGMHVLPVILLSNILSGVVFNLSFWYKQAGRTRVAILVTGTGLVFTLVFNVLLVPSLGYLGAALARLACEVAMVAVSYRLNRRHSPTPYDLRRVGEYALAGAVLFAAGMAAGGWPAAWRYPLNGLLLAAFCLLATRRERIDVVSLIKSILKR
jgi:O-antigen/teichoic acid export membrane protein